MPTEPEVDRPEFDADEEDGGGPVKSFLEHLEDLRWVLIKSIVAIGIGMLVCLIAADHVLAILKGPLARAKIKYPGTNQIWTVSFGTNRLGVFRLDDEQQRSFAIGTNRFVPLKLEPAVIGTNLILTFRPDPNTDPASAQHLDIRLQGFGPVTAFVVALHVALYGGIVLASPFVFYFVAGFIFPALKMREKHYVYRGLGFGLTLFAAGVSFCYFVLLPVALQASVMYANWMGLDANLWRAEEYISFVCKFMLGMGIGFQMPVVLLTLVRIGILSYSTLSKMRKYMIVINLVLGALLTTPEVITQVLMALPLQILYEISVWIAWYWERRDRKRAVREAKGAQ
ncbi:MAG: twin-arginine translocase subunit TatC [Verrucomicrobia bacterium]|nr:MAG: twin-arginine translocase subunit TatC [Verrucomicrobiota bacterium]